MTVKPTRFFKVMVTLSEPPVSTAEARFFYKCLRSLAPIFQFSYKPLNPGYPSMRYHRKIGILYHVKQKKTREFLDRVNSVCGLPRLETYKRLFEEGNADKYKFSDDVHEITASQPIIRSVVDKKLDLPRKDVIYALAVTQKMDREPSPAEDMELNELEELVEEDARVSEEQKKAHLMTGGFFEVK